MVRCLPTTARDQQHEGVSKRSIDDSKPLFLTETSKDDLIKATPLTDEEEDKQPEQDIEILVEDIPIVEDNFEADLVPAGSSIVFRPLFVYRYQQIKRRRRPRSAEELISAVDEATNGEIRRDKRDTESTKYKQVLDEELLKSTNDGEMEFAESAIVFRPIFRYKRRFTTRRRGN